MNDSLPESTQTLRSENAVELEPLLSQADIALAPTQFSSTGPLMKIAKSGRLRAATMPGFSEIMIPALLVDMNQVAARIDSLETVLRQAVRADITMRTDDQAEFHLTVDLRGASIVPSGGKLTGKSLVVNWPTGEIAVVPNEGARGIESITEGSLPV